MKILIEVEVLPAVGWRVLKEAEVELFGAVFVTDAPEDYFLRPDDEDYGLQVYVPHPIAQDLGQWIRDGVDLDRSDPPLRVGSIVHYGEIGSV